MTILSQMPARMKAKNEGLTLEVLLSSCNTTFSSPGILPASVQRCPRAWQSSLLAPSRWDICIFAKMQDTQLRQGCSTKGSQCWACPTTLLCSLCFLLTPPARSPLQETAAASSGAPGTPTGFLLAAFQHAQRSWWKRSGKQLTTTENWCTRAGRRVVSENAEKVSFWCLGS